MDIWSMLGRGTPPEPYATWAICRMLGITRDEMMSYGVREVELLVAQVMAQRESDEVKAKGRTPRGR